VTVALRLRHTVIDAGPEVDVRRRRCVPDSAAMTVARDDVRGRPVGVLDAGTGGLAVLHDLLVRVPREDYVYLGDTVRRPPAALPAFALAAAGALLEREVKLLVVACGATAAAALPALRAAAPGIAVLGVVEPAALEAVATTRRGCVGVLAGAAEIDAHAAAVAALDQHVDVLGVACDHLASRLEAGAIDAPLLDAVRHLCAPLADAAVDTVILGSAHVSLVRPIIERMLGTETSIITPGAPLARRVERVLSTSGLQSAPGAGGYALLCAGEPGPFRARAARLLPLPLAEVEPVRLAAPVDGTVAA
jgi:glutamate racemase